jgi:hypothetical protein
MPSGNKMTPKEEEEEEKMPHLAKSYFFVLIDAACETFLVILSPDHFRL